MNSFRLRNPVEGHHHSGAKPIRIPAGGRSPIPEPSLTLQLLWVEYRQAQLVEVRSTATTVEIFHKSQRVASHLRARTRGQTVTNPEHRPKSHHAIWNGRLGGWCIGPKLSDHSQRVCLNASWPHPEMGYRGCLGIIRLAAHYSVERMEAAAGRAPSQSVKSILKGIASACA